MFYTPGPKAFAEYEAFTNRQAKTKSIETVNDPALPSRRKASLQTTLDLAVSDPTLLEELTRRGIAQKMARELLSNLMPGQDVIGQVEYVDTLIAKDRRGKLNNPPGLYIYHIRENLTPPTKHLPGRQVNGDRNDSQPADDGSSAGLERLVQYEEYRATEVKRFIRERISSEEHGTLLKEHLRRNKSLFKRMSATQLDAVTERSIIGELTESGRVQLMSFEEFIGSQGVECRAIKHCRLNDPVRHSFLYNGANPAPPFNRTIYFPVLFRRLRSKCTYHTVSLASVRLLEYWLSSTLRLHGTGRTYENPNPVTFQTPSRFLQICFQPSTVRKDWDLWFRIPNGCRMLLPGADRCRNCCI